jgi:TfoX/Sxy family transcriptional regulator of competence genes
LQKTSEIGAIMESVSSVEILAERVRAVLDRPITVKRMFGGLTFLLEGNMLCCVSTKGLMVRVGAAAEPEALKRPLVARCLGAGRPTAGFLLVEPQGVASDADLRAWLDLALAYVGDLPPKNAEPRKTKSLGPKARHQISRRVP